MHRLLSLQAFLLLSVILVPAPLAAEDLTGLHNSTKKFTLNTDMLASDWENSDEIDRVWQHALVRIPTSNGAYLSTQIKNGASVEIDAKKKFPTVIYMHGCTGIWEGTLRRINHLAESGFAVVAPTSLARQKYPQSCDAVTHVGGMYRKTLLMRQIDAQNAIMRAKKLPWVDPDNVFLMGLSQGAITTATFKAKSKGASVNARVVEGWTCNAGWSEYKGINAPESEPVLTLVGEMDPWFQDSWTAGDCTKSINPDNGSISVVYKDPPLKNMHALYEHDEVKEKVIAFLKSHIR